MRLCLRLPAGDGCDVEESTREHGFFRTLRARRARTRNAARVASAPWAASSVGASQSGNESWGKPIACCSRSTIATCRGSGERFPHLTNAGDETLSVNTWDRPPATPLCPQGAPLEIRSLFGAVATHAAFFLIVSM